MMMKFTTLSVAVLAFLLSPCPATQPQDLLQNGALESFRPVGGWRGVAEVAAVPGKMEFTSTGDGRIVVNGDTKDLKIPYLLTREEYGDVRIELEFMVPKGSNSGVYVMGRYEVQIFDSFGRPRVGSGDLGGIYQRWDPARPKDQQGFEGVAPMANAAKAPGEWQSLDIHFRAPRFNEAGGKLSDATFEKVFVNGVLVQENATTTGHTRSAPMEGDAARGPIAIQGDHGPIAIRAFRVTPLADPGQVRLAELDAYWAEVSRAVREGDFKAYTATCHPEGVLISGRREYSQPLATALARWQKDFADTREGRVKATADFRFSKRLGDATTAHETGILRFISQPAGEAPKVEYIDLEALLVKKPDGWKILMEYQIGETTEAAWEALKQATPLPDPREADDPKLPRVLVIGDSISMNYHEAAKAALKGIANYHRNEGNAGSSANGVSKAELWLGNHHEKGLHWDVIQLNHGLHDLKQSYDAASDTWGDYTIPITEYKANLEKEIAILRTTGAKLIWCSTTPVPNSNMGTFARRKGACAEFNAAALEVIHRHPDILVNNLHAVVDGSPVFDNWRKGKDVHFYQKEEQRVLGEAVAATVRKALEKPGKKLPLPGETFTVEGRPAFLILPEKRDTAKPTPWVWYAPTLPNLPAKEETWMFERFLEAGIAIAGIDVGESMGKPAGRALFTAFHKELVTKRGMAAKPCLLARSRGGLMLYNWAAENPQSVAAIAGIYPVGDLASWPGLARASAAYGLTEAQLAAQLTDHNPIDRLAPLARAGIPIMHIHGDNDTVVPLEKNSGLIKQRYDELGGRMTLEVIKDGGHDMKDHWFKNQPLVLFIIRQLTSPYKWDSK